MFNFQTRGRAARILEKSMLEDQDRVKIARINKLAEEMI